MRVFEEYSEKYRTIRMRREDGILEMQFDTDAGPLRWSLLPHGELEKAFLDVGRDPENLIVILTGTGDEFSGPTVSPGGHNHARTPVTAEAWDAIYWEGKHLLMSQKAAYMASIKNSPWAKFMISGTPKIRVSPMLTRAYISRLVQTFRKV